MKDIAREAERNYDYVNHFNTTKLDISNNLEALGQASTNLAHSSGSKVIICLSEDTKLVEYLSFLKPDAHIMYPHYNNRTRRGMNQD